MHVLFVLLISLCQIFDSKWQVIVTKIITVVVSVLFIMKMIYQIEYIEHTDYDVNCTVSKKYVLQFNCIYILYCSSYLFLIG